MRNVEPNLDLVLGPGSTFGLQDEAHRRRRKLLVPRFTVSGCGPTRTLSRRKRSRRCATWPEGREFEVLASTNRITLNVILRAVFGAEGAEFDALRKVMPPLVALGSQLVFMPWLHRDLGSVEPVGGPIPGPAKRIRQDHRVADRSSCRRPESGEPRRRVVADAAVPV